MIKNTKAPRIVIFLSITIVLFILVFFTIYLLERKECDRPAPKYDFIFHQVDFETDILTDPDYLALDRSVSFKQGNQTVTIDKNFRSENGTVEFMLDYLDCIISGDYKRYGDFFSELYFESESVPEIFTMQRVYEITIEFLGETFVSKSNKNYAEYRLSLDYKINRNDGTLRNDMGSDCFRTQYFLITNRDGDLKIDTIKSYDIVEEVPLKISSDVVYACCAVILLLVVAVVYPIIRKRRRRGSGTADREKTLK